jgi:hypothetical protein
MEPTRADAGNRVPVTQRAHDEEIIVLRNGRTIPSDGRHRVTVFNHFISSEEMVMADKSGDLTTLPAKLGVHF